MLCTRSKAIRMHRMMHTMEVYTSARVEEGEEEEMMTSQICFRRACHVPPVADVTPNSVSISYFRLFDSPDRASQLVSTKRGDQKCSVCDSNACSEEVGRSMR